MLRIMSEAPDKSFDNFYELKLENPKKMRATRQRLADLEHDVRQPRLAAKVDVPTVKKTHTGAEEAPANQAKHGDSCSAKKVDPDPMCLTSFRDDSTEPPALPCRDDVLVNKGAAVPKPCLSPVEMRTLTAAGGLPPASTAFVVTRAIFHQSPLWLCPTEEINFRASIQYATMYFNSFWK